MKLTWRTAIASEASNQTVGIDHNTSHEDEWCWSGRTCKLSTHFELDLYQGGHWAHCCWTDHETSWKSQSDATAAVFLPPKALDWNGANAGCIRYTKCSGCLKGLSGLLDFCAAFGTVDLLRHFEVSLGIGGVVVESFWFFLANRSQAVTFQGVTRLSSMVFYRVLSWLLY